MYVYKTKSTMEMEVKPKRANLVSTRDFRKNEHIKQTRKYQNNKPKKEVVE